MKKQIEIRIYPNGKIETATHNVKGKACLDYIAPLEKLLEAKVIDSEFTSEYYEQEVYDNNNSDLTINLKKK
jgi:hypothetical protein